MRGGFVGSKTPKALIWTNRVLDIPSFCAIVFEFAELYTQLLFLFRVEDVFLPEPARCNSFVSTRQAHQSRW